ncbi:MAG: alpha-2-macroglobulin [Bacteroidales bacterium]|nr:alpha-2-macroglobulin [Bacteroidales bacterium]
MRIWKLFLLTCGLTALFSACNRHHETIPSMDFANYISAYTGGSIASDEPIRVVFAQDVESAEIGKNIEKNVFSFSPSLKGHAFWENSHTITFVPDSGELKQGKSYKAKFLLSEFYPVSRKLRKFPFSFHVQQREFSLKMLPMTITAANPDEVTLRGQLAFNEPVRKKDALKMLEVKGTYSSITFPDMEKSTMFEFTVNGIKKTDKPQQIRITADGKRIGSKDKFTVEAEIPVRNKFEFLSYEYVTAPENGLELVFSEPVATEQDLRGLIELPAVASTTMLVKQNVVKINFAERSGTDSMTLRIAGSLKSSTGRILQRNLQMKVKTRPLSPQIALLSEGVILPDAENLKLNFKAVSLNAVDVEVIRIYQRNVLSFLQVNRLDGNQEIRRAGRLIYRQKLELNPPMASVNSWHNYAVDLGRIIRQEEGAIYQVRLSFKREYASAPFYRGSESVTGNRGMTALEPPISAEEDKAWDEVNSYYSYFGYPYDDNDYYDYYYDDYSWSNRENPYTASYYMVNRSVSTNLLASNLGIMVKANDNGKYWVVVNDILTAEPVRGADISLYNLQLQPIASGKTDHKGIAELETPSVPFIAVATKGKQNSYLRLVDGENNSYSRFDVSGEKSNNGLKGFLYGERGVWRPGDTLHLTLILEDRNRQLPDNHPASIEIFNPRGQFFHRKVNPSSVDGFYTFAVPIPSDAPTGIWNAYVHVGQATFHKGLHIETVKPNRLNIDLQLPDTMLNIRSNSTATLHAALLTGATASQMQAQVEMQTSKAKVPVKGFEKYVFTNPLADASPQTVRIFDGRLSETGNARITVPAMASGQLPGKIKAQFVCRVMEPGGDASVISKNAILSPYATYVGVRSNLSSVYPYVETNTDHHFDIVTVTENGKLVNRSNLTYYFYKIDWSYWWDDDEEALGNYINNTNAKVVKSGRISTVNGKASIPFRIDYPEYGKFLFFIKDQNGHATGCLFNVDWPSWRGNPDAKNPSAVQMLSFSLDKPEYKVGDEVLVTIPKLQSGIALVSIENGSEVIEMHRVKIKEEGTTNYRFKVTEEMTPNAYVQISVIQPHRLTVDNMPIRMYGVEPFTVTDPKSMLSPQISCPKVVRPQQPFTVTVSESGKRPMTYTLAVVDEGLLSLTHFKTPDPWKKFHTRDALGIRTWDVYNNVVGAFAGKYARMFSVGGDENLELSPAKANRFTPVVRFIGPFTLKKGEKKSHTITLPQYVGAVRVMVVAGHDGAYGSAEKTTTVRTPLMLLPSLPRVLSVNESIELPVNVFAMEASVKDVTLKVTTTGKAAVKGAATQQIRFSRTGDKMAYFTLETGKLTGTEKITITATGNGHTAKEVVEIEIRNPNPLLAFTKSVLVDKQKSVALPYQLQQGGKESLLQLEVATLPSLNITGQFDFLENYSHACSEQLVSKALPLLFKEHFVTLTDADKKEIASSIATTISNLYARQLPSGGFSYWPGGQVSDWLTSYVGHLLILAQEKGYEVNQNVYNKWLGYQRKNAQNWQAKRKNAAGYSFTQSDLEQAYRLYTLALAGKAETGAMNRLKGYTGLSLQARWRLAAAYAISGKKKTALEIIQRATTTVQDYTSDNSTFGSSLRDEAMILETMVLTGQSKEAFQQARLIAQQLQGEPFYSTHSSAYAIIAIAQLYDKFDNGMEFAWSQNGGTASTVSTGKAAFQKRLPLKNLSGKVTIQNKGKGALYASLYQRSRPITDTAAPRQRNIAMQVSYTDMSGKTISPNQLQQGADFNVTIRVTNLNPSQMFRNVALTYILPSGWEVVNERYFDEYEPVATRYSYQDIRDDRVFTYFDLPVRGSMEVRLRLRASYCGRFILPAVKCEAMYDPQSYARTAAGFVSVNR